MENSGELIWRDHAIVYALGVGVAILSWLSGNNAEIPPDLWDEVTVAIGLRPPPTIFPCLWRCQDVDDPVEPVEDVFHFVSC